MNGMSCQVAKKARIYRVSIYYATVAEGSTLIGIVSRF